MNIGSRLKQILEERKMNVSQLSREADVSAQTLYAMIKRDSNKADMDIMARLLEALDMDLMEFLQMEPRKKGAKTMKAKAGSEKKQAEASADEERAAEEQLEEAEEPEEARRGGRRDIEDYLL